jgi:spermidine/putrescine ABC transporter ATP-binding subunit
LASLAVESLAKSFGSVVALDNVSLEIKTGEFVTLLGPSGCGKTTFLRLVAGLERPTNGRIYLDGECINDIPPYRCEMGLVVQNYALFPHMTVFDNVAYGLKVRRLGAEEIGRRVGEALDMVRLSGFEKRFPRQLSGGQQQRCALARAIVIRPRVLLLDEALGALDKKLREEMQVELKQLQRQLHLTTLHVTHDQEEALGMSDRIVVLNHGSVEQFGAPLELYNHPKTEFVASFIGDANVFRAKVEKVAADRTIRARSEDNLDLVCTIAGAVLSLQDQIIVVVRPEHISLLDTRPEEKENLFEGRIEAVVYHGNAAKVVVGITNERRILVLEPSLSEVGRQSSRQGGDQVWITWSPGDARVVRP